MSVVAVNPNEVYEEFEDFVRLVRDMRAAQKKYFADRSPRMLSAARSLEHAVDDAIDRSHGLHQTTLF